ncbi:hypothetical protein DICVIV_01232 [Dictyocaulus viviparus]|uniref:Uncharacterized protein n=1 Tax=Dictyocaulus viviparus TaxID=29172 RepID=A0A0D8Y8I9_DICVI|nr:hypothetical protein DICVIV_01232 [Dictyocaulus viviparus]
MEDGKSSPNVKNEVFGFQNFDFEREIQILERDIRQQKESSVNAKTAITFEQLRKIHNLGKLLGPQKEVFFDRICRAADIQRASLKNRLKQNKEKFEPPALNSYRQIYQDQSTPNDSNSCLMTPHWQQIAQFNSTVETPRTPSSSTAELAPLFGPGSVTDEEWKMPAERSLDLMHLGFSFDEVKQIVDLFDQYKEIMKPHNPNLTLSQVLTLFANFISISVPDNLKLLSFSFNLLEMGYSRQEVARLLAKERKRYVLDTIDMDMKPKRPRSSLTAELPNGESFPIRETNGNQSDDEV